MESGVVKLTPQWLSFTNNQPQGKDLGGISGGGGNVGSSEDRRSGSQYDNYRERYDRTGGRYNNNSSSNNYSSARGSQYGYTKHTSSTNNLGANSISQNDYGGNNSTNNSHNNTPSNFNRSKSLTTTFKKEETPLAQVQPQTIPMTNSITSTQQHVQTQQSPSQSLQSQPQPQLQQQQQQQPQQQVQITSTESLSPISTSVSQPTPPRSLYDKNFPSLSGGMLFAAIAPATSPPLPSTSYPSTSKQGGKVTPVSMSTSPPPNGSGTKGQPWSPRGGSPPVDGIAKSISPPISNGIGSSTNQGHSNGTNTTTVLSPMPTQATPPAAILRITSPTPKAGPVPSKSVSPSAPSPSPPPLATKTPAASIIREPPKVIAKGPGTASSGGLVPTPSTELERAKSLVPTQPIVPKPLAKNLSMNSKQNSKQFVQPKGRVGPTIGGGVQSVGSGMQSRVLKKSGNELEFDGSLQSESEPQESATTKPNPVNPTPTVVKTTPRNNFFSSLRKQEEQKKKGGDSTTTLATVGLSSSASSLAATPSSGDATVTTSSSLPFISSSSSVSTSAQPKASESTSTPASLPSLVEALSSSSSFPPSSPPSSPISIPSPSASQETFGVLFLSEEEEQRLLKQFGWSPEDEEGEEEEFYIPDEEIEALRNRLNQQKESFDQLRELRLLSLAQSVEQWQQRLFSSSAIPIKSP